MLSIEFINMIERKQRRNKQQPLVIILVIVSFAMLIFLIFLSWFVFDVLRNQEKNGVDQSYIDSSIKSYLAEAGKIEKESEEKKNVVKNRFWSDNLNTEEVVAMISRHILLTEGEITVATVENIDGLRGDYPELFQYAKNGDKLLFYDNGIIIYDAILDKIVDVLRRLPEGTFVPNTPN